MPSSFMYLNEAYRHQQTYIHTIVKYSDSLAENVQSIQIYRLFGYSIGLKINSFNRE